MANMNMPDSWANENALVEHLGGQLAAGRLGLFLGAGVSQFYGLPSWEELIERLCRALGEPVPAKGTSPIKTAGTLKSKHFRSNEDGFKAAVKRALYDGVTLDFAKIRLQPLLAAIGSLVMSSHRGSAAKVITLNYDNLLESYLEYHGFTTATVADGCHWAHNQDVVIYHPHGFLPLGRGLESKAIVLGTSEYLGVMTSPLWRPILETALRQHTFLYLGLSGDDLHLNSHWNELSKHHAIVNDRFRYHGVRFTTDPTNDENTNLTEEWGIFTHILPNHDALPDFLFRICQSAREKRMRN